MLKRPLTIHIDSDIWEKFKEKTPRTISLNNRVVQLIKKDIGIKQG